MTAETSRRRFLKLLAAAGVGLAVPLGLPFRVEAAFRIGDAPSRVTLSDLRGNPVVVPSDFKRQVVLIHFWASWCPTCRGEMETLELIYRKYKGKVTPCSIGLGEKKETATRYLKNIAISYPVLLDPAMSAKKPFGVTGVPTFFALDREGVIRHRILGSAKPEGLEKIIRSLL